MQLIIKTYYDDSDKIEQYLEREIIDKDKGDYICLNEYNVKFTGFDLYGIYTDVDTMHKVITHLEKYDIEIVKVGK